MHILGVLISWSLLQFLTSAQLSEASLSLTRFLKVQRCPTANTQLHPVKLSSKIQCAGICTGQSRCNAFHFDPITNKCYLGDACSTLEQWTVGACDSYVYTDESAAAASSTPLLEQLQMKLFYKFKKSGLVNEANPRQFCLTAHDVTVGSNGAEFKGHSGSYLITETPGFERFLDYGNTYSIFVQVRHAMDPSRDQVYFRIQQCPPSTASGASFLKANNYVYTYAYFNSGGSRYRYSKSLNFLPTDSQRTLVSTGYAFNGTVHQHFYFNQSLIDVASVSLNTGSTNISNYQFLTLGHITDSARCLAGSMYCFGLSAKVLGLDEFKQLENFCTN